MNQKLVIRILALLLVLAMVLGMIPLVFAEEGNLGSGTTDTTAPKLLNIEISTDTIIAPGKIEITAYVSDDASGASHAQLDFCSKDTERSLSCSLENRYYDKELQKWIPYPEGILRGVLDVDQYVKGSTYVLALCKITDRAGNKEYYFYDDTTSTFPEQTSGLCLTVINNVVLDSKPPVLDRIELSTAYVNAPGKIEITAYVSDDISGTRYANLQFYCQNTNEVIHCTLECEYYDEMNHEWVPYPTGILRGTLDISSHIESGTFVLVWGYFEDRTANGRIYYNDASEDAFPDGTKNLRFTVLNTVPDVTTSVANPEFVSNLENSADDAYIVADFSGEATLPETAFDAISGTDKTLDLVSEGVTWRFNGNDIVNESKPIDLNVNITRLEESPSPEIQEKLEDTPAVVMKFAENGVLPGKATIQVKVDYAMQKYLGASRELCVYYFNNQTGKLELIAENLMVIKDAYIEFPITHCSYYILSTKIEEPAEPEHEYQYGDANHDGRVNVSDSVAVMKHRAGALSEKDTFCEHCANVDTNPKINVSDAVLIMKKRANKDMLFPIEMQ